MTAGDVPTPQLRLGDEALFLVWGPPSHGPRSRVLARELGVDIEFVFSTRRRGLLVAPIKYSYQTVATLVLLARRRPRLVLVQSPPSLAVMVTALYAAFSGARYVVDAHSAAMLSGWWTRPEWLHRLLARRALATIVTNDHFAERIRGWGATALVLRDIPTAFPVDGAYTVNGAFNVMVVNTFALDEPLAAIVAAAEDLDDVMFRVTGDPGRGVVPVPGRTPANVRFTGFLADEEYYALMAASDVVMCLTTRDHTMQRGACEALSLGRPIITSHWPLLRSYFHAGTVHVDNTPSGIREGVVEMRRSHARFEEEIAALQLEQRDEWATALETLGGLLNDLDAGRRGGR